MHSDQKNSFRYLSILFLLAGIVLSSAVYGQDCEDRLEAARISYQKGNLKLVIDTLKMCSENTDNDVSLNTHRLRAMAYLGLEKRELARQEAIELLKLDPLYKPSVINDPNEFIQLINSITVLPKLSFGISFSLGSILTMPRLEKIYSAAEHTNRTYEGKFGNLFEISGLYQFNNVLALKLGLMITSNRYELSYPIENLNLSLKERITYGSIPINLRYYPNIKTRIRPFGQIGLTGSMLLGSVSSYYSEHSWYGESNSLEHISSADRRNRFVYGIGLGIGAARPLGAGLISLELNYQRSMRLANKGSARYDYTSLSNSYFHLDDDFYLDNLSIVLGYSIILNYQVLEE